MSDMENTYQRAYEQLLESERKWRFDGITAVPAYDDVKLLLDRMIDQVRKASGSISVESGGLLVKRTDKFIDIYVHVGETK